MKYKKDEQRQIAAKQLVKAKAKKKEPGTKAKTNKKKSETNYIDEVLTKYGRR